MSRGPRVNDIRDFYEIGRKLGEGGNAVVYEATCKQTGEKYAIKALKLQSPSCREDARQAVIFKLTGHENVIQLREILQDPRGMYIVMELATGGDLFDRIEERLIASRTGFTEKEIRHTVASIARALYHLHARGIVHLDLKPENIIYKNKEPDAPLKLCDFGFATIVKEEEALRLARGTPQYVAPEVLLSRQKTDGTHEGGLGEHGYGTQADLWSLGVILFILISGCFPFDSSQRNAVARQKAILQKIRDYKDGNIVFPSRGFIPAGARSLILKLLKRDPNDRLTAKQVLQDEWILHGDKKEERQAASGSGDLPLYLNFADLNERRRQKLYDPTLSTIMHKVDAGNVDPAAKNAVMKVLDEGFDQVSDFEFQRSLMDQERGLQALITMAFQGVKESNDRIQETVAQELADFSMRSRERQERLLEGGGIRAIVHLIKRATSQEAKRFAALALMNFFVIPATSLAPLESPGAAQTANAAAAGNIFSTVDPGPSSDEGSEMVLASGRRTPGSESQTEGPADFIFHEVVSKAVLEEKGVEALASLMHSLGDEQIRREGEAVAPRSKNPRLAAARHLSVSKPGGALLLRQVMRTLSFLARHSECHEELIRLHTVEPLVQFACTADIPDALRRDLTFGLAILADNCHAVPTLVGRAREILDNISRGETHDVADKVVCKKVAMLLSEATTRHVARQLLYNAGAPDLVRRLLYVPEEACLRHALVALCHLVSEVVDSDGVIDGHALSWVGDVLHEERFDQDEQLCFLKRWLRKLLGEVNGSESVEVLRLMPDRPDQVCVKVVAETAEVRNDAIVSSMINIDACIPEMNGIGSSFAFATRLVTGGETFIGWARNDFLEQHRERCSRIDIELESEIMTLKRGNFIGHSTRSWGVNFSESRAYNGNTSKYFVGRAKTGDTVCCKATLTSANEERRTYDIRYEVNGRTGDVAFRDVTVPSGYTLSPAISLGRNEQLRFFIDKSTIPSDCTPLQFS